MTEPFAKPPNAALILADGTVFSGYGVGKEGITAGEICFNTAMTGYQEILTDPSYTGQIITFTFPHIGNVGCNTEDIESEHIMGACGVVLREAITEPSSFRAHQHFNDWLLARDITGISGVDTRALTRHIREHGAQNCAIGFSARSGAFSDIVAKTKQALAQAPDMHGLELAAHVTTKENHAWNTPVWHANGADAQPQTPNPYHVVAVDYGVKLNILRNLTSAGCRITVVPATATAEEILALNPAGVFLSNGPGDPAATAHYAVPTIHKLLGSGLPIFGICLGHQLLGLALNAKTEKMPQGHRGANHPVQDLRSKKVEITSQNHGFCISDSGLPADIEVTHRSLFDGTIQGIRHRSKPVFSVQGHPEASPGPHDSQYLFTQFVALMRDANTELKHAS
jgi:carbamoyl-phosphate synthase small subunit